MKFLRLALTWLFFCAPVSAQVGQIPAWPPLTTATLPSPVVAFAFSGGLSASGSTLTAANITLGPTTGFTTRRIILLIQTNAGATNGRTLVSGTINGVSVTIHAQTAGTAALPSCAIVSADVATGNTSQTVTMTYNGTLFSSAFLGVYTVDDALLVSTIPSTGTNTIPSTTTTLSTSSFTQTAGGFTIAGMDLASANTLLAMTGYTNDAGGGTTAVIESHLAPVATTGSTTATATWGSNQANGCIIAASWR